MSIDLARLTDSLGYHRYWVAEHHATPGLACTAPEILIGQIGMVTSRLRVGSGGVMLPHYSPFKVAENFSLLSGLFPGRIDLGIGRAPGTDQETAFALQRDRRRPSPDDFPEQLSELMGYFEDPRSRRNRLARLTILPGAPNAPEIWLLGSSPQSSIWAAEFGLPYMFADFINPLGAEIAARYREEFRPSAQLSAPRLGVASWAICAETDREAEEHATSFRMMMALLHRGELIPVPPVEKAKRFLREEGKYGSLQTQRRTIVGAPPTVRDGIERVAEEYGADEVMLVNILYDHGARRRSYELIAEAFELTTGSEPGSRAGR